ncbi:hypothetical protein ABZX88_10530 [Kitasatospora aureofaciens]|uniref:hypothetical protein n=2 Tax=Kitasatospora aureofaciens TaxID=1894 RepID=UPI00131C3B7E|nr:hypothetical protein [Kitasatospora aureofaciens]
MTNSMRNLSAGELARRFVGRIALGFSGLALIAGAIIVALPADTGWGGLPVASSVTTAQVTADDRS